MIEFLIALIPVCLGIWAINILFQEDHLLEKAGEYMEDHWPKYINKPLWACQICMSSLWGLVGFIAIRYFFGVDLPWKQLIPFIFCQCGLNAFLTGLTSKKITIKEFDSDAFRQLYDLKR